jgi:bacteriocin biosynthesis cyclodehydratase domain-containing protein
MQWNLTSLPHLVIAVEPEGAVVGPLVLPGRTACTRCIALRRVDADRHWGVVEMARLHHALTPSAVVAHLAAAHAAVHALSYIDTGMSAAVNATLHLSLADGFTRPRTWSPHPLCGCMWR